MWLKNGDRSSKFCHQAIQRRRGKNSIINLVWNEDIISEPKVIKETIFEHFRNQFSRRDFENILKVKAVLAPKLSEVDNLCLQRLVSIEDIESALSQCNSDKVPGPDGLNSGALKLLWPSIKEDMLKTFSHFMESGQLPGGMNSSFITLIPKVMNPSSIKDFRPISLIYCSLKILSKILIDRLSTSNR